MSNKIEDIKVNKIFTYFDNLIFPTLSPSSNDEYEQKAKNTLNVIGFDRYEVALRRIKETQGSDIDTYNRICSQGVKECLTWKGSPLYKSHFDFCIYFMLISEIKPKTILEIGSTRTSLEWLSSITKINDYKCEIIGIDRNSDNILLDEVGNRFQLIQDDIKNINSIFKNPSLKNLKRPLLIVEDAHAYLDLTLEYLFGLLEENDYIIVEDSIGKQKVIESIIRKLNLNQEIYVDKKYTDFFGVNSTSAVNSILVKKKKEVVSL